MLNEPYIDFYELSDSLSKEYNEYMNEQEKKGIIKREGLKLFDSDVEPFYISFKEFYLFSNFWIDILKHF